MFWRRRAGRGAIRPGAAEVAALGLGGKKFCPERKNQRSVARPESLAG